MKLLTRMLPAFVLLGLLGPSASVVADDVDRDLEAIRAVGPGGAGSKEARESVGRLAAYGPELLPRLLVAMDTNNIVAANWYRSVYDQVVGRELSNESPRLPVQFLRRYARDSQRQGRVRRLVLDSLDRIDPDYRKQLIPTLLSDPEFRSDAVAETLRKGDAAKEAGDAEQAKGLYEAAFVNARESDQVVQLAGRLQAAGKEVSIIEHMGFVIDWHVLGPFDAPEKTGFALEFPPEQKVDLKAEYDGKDGKTIRWTRHETTDQLGQVNLAQAIAPVAEAVGYAYAELASPKQQSAQVRCGADDNLTVWLNGEKVLSREQWLNGIRLDRFIAPVTLREGTNRVLVKICQGPQHKNPDVGNAWTMQLRFCDAEGTGLGLTPNLPPAE